MRKTIIILLATFIATLRLSAEPVSPDKAHTVATNFMQAVTKSAVDLTDITASLPYGEFYVFTSGDAFVIVAGDDCVTPILAYSTANAFRSDKMPSNIRMWLQSYEDQIAFIKSRERMAAAYRLTTDAPNPLRSEWDDLANGSYNAGPENAIIGPLLQTTWDQSPYYNNQCPYDASANDRAVTGCTATATAQVMKYYGWPASGYGSHSYSHSLFGTLSANFGNTTHSWSSMPNALSSSSSTAQVNAIATLMYHIGVAVEMDYGVDGSGAATLSRGDITNPSAENALKTYFKYSPSLHGVHMEDYTPSEWHAMLLNEISNSRPVIYTGYDNSGGHAFVCDGANTTNGKFHFNWGWGGWCDGYYTIGALNPSSGGTGGNSSYTFNLDNSAIIGITPSGNWNSSTTVTATANNSSYGSVTGGGSKPFGDTVTLRANANSGHRFAQWSDGYKFNPRQFIATGGNVTLTAQFEPLGGDTISYCSKGHNLTALGYGGGSDTYWGIKLPASTLASVQTLNAVQVFITTSGSYDLTIYSGSTYNAVYTHTYNISSANADKWNTLTLTTPLTVNTTQPLWITLHNTDAGYPAAMTYSAGNSDAILWGSNFSSLASSWDYSFMIRGIFQSGSSSTDQGDTLSYCADSSHVTNVGAGGNLYWGISLSPTQLSGHNTLESVLLYVAEAGSYTLNIYSGTDSNPTTLLRNATYNLTTTNAYNLCALASPLAINPNEHLWVTFHNNTITYPAAACNYTGDPHSNWTSVNGTTWSPLHQLSATMTYSWMIKCVTSQSMAAADIVVSGPENIRAGEANTYTATVTQTGYNISWTLQGATPATATGTTATATWNNAGTYNIIATATSGTIVIRDTLQVTVTSCPTIATFPYTMGFESNESTFCWDNWSESSSATAWMQYNWSGGGTVSHTGNGSLGSIIDNASYRNWLATPQIAVPVNSTTTMEWYDLMYADGGNGEVYQLLASTDNGSSWTTLQSFSDNSTSTDWIARSQSLDAFAGQTIRLAFRHASPNDYTYAMIDDITIASETLPYTTVSFVCGGTGTGSVERGYEGMGGNLCGSTDQVPVSFGATYNIIPASYSYVEHIYVNNVDRLAEAHHGDNGTYSWYGIIDGATTINVVFSLPTHYLEVLSEDETMGHVTGGGVYNHGDIATITAIPNSGYMFNYWVSYNYCSDESFIDNPLSIEVNQDIQIIAKFMPLNDIEQAEAKPMVSIYPNPAVRVATIALNGFSGDASLTIVDATGRTVMQHQSQNRDCVVINLEKFAKGIYYVKVSDAFGANVMDKLVVK